MKNVQLGHDQHRAAFKKYPLCFLAHDIDVPMNVGSLFRIADAFGVEKLYLTGLSPVPPNSKITKTSRSTEKYVSFSYEKNPLEVVRRLKSEGYTIISLEITSASTDIRKLAVSRGEKVCLVLGSENTGVCQELLDASDKTIHIPMLGQNSSLNVATACSIATFEIIRGFVP
jgi:tRNA G18 (ribose-2'-O)-methylase SpoU